MRHFVRNGLVLLLAAAIATACAPRVRLFGGGAEDPLRESVLEGSGPGRVAVIDVRGFLGTSADRGLLRDRPSVVQEVTSRLKRAEADAEVGALVLLIDSPGGTVTASDILYHEITAWKERTRKPVVAVLMDVAASGGYYAALAADRIVAHPTTVTGSVGVVFYLPKVYGLLDKVGVSVDVAKSGRNKDMGSPFRAATDEERALARGVIDDMAARFLNLVKTRRGDRGLTEAGLGEVATARVFTAAQAKGLGLVDQVGYVEDGFKLARELGGLGPDAEVVAWRRDEVPDDSAYNTASSALPGTPALLSLGGLDAALPPHAGFYYLWSPGLAQ